MNLHNLVSSFHTIGATVVAADQAMNEAQKHHAQCVAVKDALRGLRHSWVDESPGKYQNYWFFVRLFDVSGVNRAGMPIVSHCQACWVREFTADPTAAAKKMSESKSALRPPFTQIEAVQTSYCGICQKDGVLVGCYAQTEDTPEGDLWTLTISTLCLSCPALTDIAERTEDDSFLGAVLIRETAR